MHTTNQQAVSGITVLDRNTTCALLHPSATIEVYDGQLCFTKRINLQNKCIEGPLDIIRCSSSTVLISDYTGQRVCEVHVFKETVTGTWKMPSSPVGLSLADVHAKGKCLYVVFPHLSAIYEYMLTDTKLCFRNCSRKLKLGREINLAPLGIYSPEYCMKLSNGNIIITHKGTTHGVSEINDSGSCIINSFGNGGGNREYQMKEPRGLVFNNRGDICVADKENNRIVVLDRSFNLLYLIEPTTLSINNLSTLIAPQALCFNDFHNSLLVGEFARTDRMINIHMYGA